MIIIWANGWKKQDVNTVCKKYPYLAERLEENVLGNSGVVWYGKSRGFETPKHQADALLCFFNTSWLFKQGFSATAFNISAR